MTDKKFTNEDIISSLEVIATTRNCNECKIRNCKWGTCNCEQITANAALDLINRQKAEIERLENALLALMNYLNIIGCDKSDVSFIKIATDLNKQIRADIKSQSVKDFAERLKENATTKFDWNEYVDIEEVDNLLKEMAGE